jgi:competence protein ComEC
MLLSIIAYAAGVLTVHQLTELPDIVWLWSAAGIIIGCFFLRYWRLLFFLMGFIWAAGFAMERLQDQLPPQLEGIDLRIEGEIIGLPQVDDRRVRFNFLPTSSSHALQLPTTVRLTWYYPEKVLKAGQYWHFTVRLKRPHGNLNPGGFDYERWLFVRGIGATGYVRKAPAAVLIQESSGWFNISNWRQTIADRISILLPGSAYLGVMKALIVGKKDEINQRQWEVFRQTGTIHLMAISGLHIGLIAGLVFVAVSRLWAWTGILILAPPRVAAAASVVAAFFYAALAGFSIPTQRALVMLLIVMAGISWQRNLRPFNILAAALIVIIILDPTAMIVPGFWLSFIAVSIIVITMSARLGKPGYWIGMLKINWATAVGLAPLTIWFFQQVSLMAPLANFVAIPIISFWVVPLLLLSVLIMTFSTMLAGWLLLLVEMGLQGLLWFLTRIAAWPFSSYNVAQSPLWTLFLATLGSLLILTPKGIPGRWLGGVFIIPLLFVEQQRLADKMIQMTLLDVGQGLATVVQTADHVLVFDTGAKYSSRFDMGKSVILPFLQSRGLQQIDTLIISHGDNDHIGGVQSLYQGMEIGQVYSSVPGLLTPYSAKACMAGQEWQWNGVTFTILSPGERLFASENDNSCVLKIQSLYGSILLTGDIEQPAESWLVDTYSDALQSDVLVAAHHGSRSSSSLDFLQKAHPDSILIPSGYRNRFGFPHQSVLQRYQKIDAEWINTADKGAITIQIAEDGVSKQSYRETAGKYWNRRIINK